MRFYRTLFAALLLVATPPVSSGAEKFEDPAPRGELLETVRALLATRPDLEAGLSQLEFHPLGHSAYLWPKHASPLRGLRVGPFWLLAKPIGTTSAANIRVVISTRSQFLDTNGAELPDSKGAATVQQTIESVKFIPLEHPDPSLIGSWHLVSSKGPFGIVLSSASWTFGSDRRFRAVQTTSERHTENFNGYFVNEEGALDIGEVDSGTFQHYDYEVVAETLRVSSRDKNGELFLEWIFERD